MSFVALWVQIWGNFGVILGQFGGNLGLFRDLFGTLIRRESFGVKSPKFGQILWRKWTFLGSPVVSSGSWGDLGAILGQFGAF